MISSAAHSDKEVPVRYVLIWFNEVATSTANHKQGETLVETSQTGNRLLAAHSIAKRKRSTMTVRPMRQHAWLRLPGAECYGRISDGCNWSLTVMSCDQYNKISHYEHLG